MTEYAPAELLDPEYWIRHPDLLTGLPLSCVDGRSHRHVVGSPGGSLGELLAVLAALEQRRGRPLDAQEVAEMLSLVRRRFGPVYHHSDRHALERLAQRLAPAGGPVPTPEGVEACLRRPPERRRQELLDALAQPENVGCGHLAGMLRRPERYEVRPELVRDLLAAFFLDLWSGAPGLVFEVLEGEHREGEVLVVRSCGHDRAWGRVPQLVPAEGSSSFVFHTDAARWFRRQLVRLLSDEGRERDPNALEQVAEVVAERHLQVTLERLAAGLPVREVYPPCAEP